MGDFSFLSSEEALNYVEGVSQISCQPQLSDEKGYFQQQFSQTSAELVTILESML